MKIYNYKNNHIYLVILTKVGIYKDNLYTCLPARQGFRVKHGMTAVNIYGFTLIELLVVIAIIGLLAGLVIINMAGVRERVRDTQRKSELNEIKKALRLYYNDNNRYPAILPPVGSVFRSASVTYMKVIPGDPLPTQQYTYYQTDCENGTDDYRLVATLENGSDPDLAKSGLRCGSGCGFTYTTPSSKRYIVCPD